MRSLVFTCVFYALTLGVSGKENDLYPQKEFEPLDFFDYNFPALNKNHLENLPTPTPYNGPLIWDYTYENAVKLSDGIPMENQLWFLLSKDTGEYEKFTPVIEEAAKTFYGKIVFVTLDVDDESNTDPLKSIQARARDAPTYELVRIYGQSMDLYKPSDHPQITKGNIEQFIQDFFDGNLLAEPISEILPDNWNEKPVKILTRENFEQVTKDKTKDVIVFYFAPWCHACQEFHPVYDHLAESFQDRGNLVFGKIDTTKNDIETTITYLPTIKLYRREDNKEIMFEGRHDRSYKRLVSFIKSQGEAECVQYGQVRDRDMVDDILIPHERDL